MLIVADVAAAVATVAAAAAVVAVAIVVAAAAVAVAAAVAAAAAAVAAVHSTFLHVPAECADQQLPARPRPAVGHQPGGLELAAVGRQVAVPQAKVPDVLLGIEIEGEKNNLSFFFFFNPTTKRMAASPTELLTIF